MNLFLLKSWGCSNASKEPFLGFLRLSLLGGLGPQNLKNTSGVLKLFADYGFRDF